MVKLFTGNMVDLIGKVVELPVRLLMTGDEIFKQFNYRGRLYSEAVNNTLELGLDVGSKAGRDNIKKIFDSGFDKNGMANVVDNDIAARALEESQNRWKRNLNYQPPKKIDAKKAHAAQSWYKNKRNKIK